MKWMFFSLSRRPYTHSLTHFLAYSLTHYLIYILAGWLACLLASLDTLLRMCFFAYRSWLFTFCTYCNCCACWTSLQYSYRLVVSQMTIWFVVSHSTIWPNNLVHVFVVLFVSWVWTYMHYNDQHRTNLQETPLSSLKSGQRLPGNLVLTKVPWTLKIHTKFKPHKKQMQRWSIYRTDWNPLERRWVFSLSRV